MKLYQRQENDPAPLAQADPYMIKASDGRYYLYATEGQVYSSDSLFGTWHYEGIRLHMPHQKVCWAPSVIEIGGTYYMYYSSMDEDSEEEHGHAMRVAVSDSPAGIFEYKKTLLPPFAIDAHVVVTPSGQYMFYCNNDYEAERAGTRILCDKMTDPLTMEGHPVCVVPPTLDEEIYQRDRFRQGQHWHTVEGAFYFYHEGYHFLNPDNHTYQPLLKKNEFIEGTGHNSVLFDQGKCYIIYHGRDYEDSSIEADTCSSLLCLSAGGVVKNSLILFELIFAVELILHYPPLLLIVPGVLLYTIAAIEDSRIKTPAS